jgi:hypothetical protein
MSAYWSIFQRVIDDFHVKNDVNEPMRNPFKEGTIESLLYGKNWIDTVQWHLEDIIRDPNITAQDALALKRRIDQRNRQRLVAVEKIDEYFLEKFRGVKDEENARMNTESPARAIDRLSILALRVYHMKEETKRVKAGQQHIIECKRKLEVLLEQKEDLETATERLLKDISSGKNYFKIYKQV